MDKLSIIFFEFHSDPWIEVTSSYFENSDVETP